MDRAQLAQWLEAYEQAWRMRGTDLLAKLFTEDATYSTAPYEKPHRGLEAIGEMWEEERLGPDEGFEMSGEIVAVEGDAGVVRVEVQYHRPKNKGVPRPLDRPPERRRALLPLRGMALLATGSAGRRRDRGRVTL